MSSKSRVFHAHVGFSDDEIAYGDDWDSYGKYRGGQLFTNRSDARRRFDDVRRCIVTIRVLPNKKRKARGKS